MDDHPHEAHDGRHTHPDLSGFSSEDRAALGQILHNQATQASLIAGLTSHFALYVHQYEKDFKDMTAQSEAATAAVAKLVVVAQAAGAAITSLEADKAGLLTQVTTLQAQVTELEGNQADTEAEQAIADSAEAAANTLQPIVDSATPPAEEPQQ